MDYIKGLCFLVFFIALLSNLGKSVNKKNDNFSMNLLIGYIIYTFFQAVGGIITQLFYIDWIYYNLYMIIVVLVFVFFEYYLLHVRKNYKLNFTNIKFSLLSHLKNYYLLYILSFILVFLALMNSSYLWMGNHQDDGWYLLKVANLPYMGNQYDVSYATGFADELGLYRALNTFEMDYAFWSNLFSIYPSVFCKAIISYFNYFLILNAVYAFIIQICNSDHKIKKTVNVVIFLLPILFFSIDQETLINHGILNQQDGWHFSTAVWYGSAIVRCLSPFLIILPFMNTLKLKASDIVFYIMICLTLVSKASQALPAIFVITAGFVGSYLIMKLNDNKKLLIVIFVIVFGILFILPEYDLEELKTYMDTQIMSIIKSPVVWFDVIVICFSYKLRNSYINFWNNCILIIVVLMFFPILNKAFLSLTFYTFVAGRTITLLIFLITLTSFSYLGIICLCYEIKRFLVIGLFLALGSSPLCVNLISKSNNFGLKTSVKLLGDNPKLIPESTFALSSRLEEISNTKGEKITVLSSGWVTSSGLAHGLGVTLKISAPDIYAISAVSRYQSMKDGIVFKDFDIERQNMFEEFVTSPESGAFLIQMLLEQYPIDIFVIDKEIAADVLIKEFNFNLLDKIEYPSEGKCYYILENPYLIEPSEKLDNDLRK